MGDLSQHFDSSEFREHGSGALIPISPQLVQVLEHLRAIDSRPIRIVSGYRSPAYNRALGGARDSQHIYGRAADLEPGRFSVAQALAAGARGVGYDRARWVVHIDVRPGSVVTFPDP